MSSLWVGSVGSVSALCILYLTLVIDASKFIFNILCFSIYNPLKDLQGTHSGHYYPLFKDTRLGSTDFKCTAEITPPLQWFDWAFWALMGHQRAVGKLFFSSFIGRGGGSYFGHAILTWASTATTPCGGILGVAWLVYASLTLEMIEEIHQDPSAHLYPTTSALSPSPNLGSSGL